MDALAIANLVRIRAAEIKQDVKRGIISVADAIQMDEMQHVRIHLLLKAQIGYGEVRIHKLLKGISISPLRRIRDLTDREKRMIVEAMGGGVK
jgi:hypothetical protein